MPVLPVTPLSVAAFRLQENDVGLNPAARTVNVWLSRVVPVPEMATLAPAVKLFAAAKVTTFPLAANEVIVATELHAAPQEPMGAGISVTNVSGELVPVEIVFVLVTTSAMVPASQMVT